MSDLTSWTIVRDCDDGSLIVESNTGARQHIWQGGDAKLLQEIARLQHERDEAREAARFLIANLDHAQEYDVETTAERQWPWLKEVEGE